MGILTNNLRTTMVDGGLIRFNGGTAMICYGSGTK